MGFEGARRSLFSDRRGGPMSRVIPREEDEELVPAGLQLPKSLRDKLDQVAKYEELSRNKVIIHFLRHALKEWERERAEEKKPKK